MSRRTTEAKNLHNERLSAALGHQAGGQRDIRSETSTPTDVSDGVQTVGEPAERWPRGISRRATMRISDVLAALRAEFPAVSHSKLRFLEEQGLVEPVRTPSGYRQYSPADVERLRFVLTEQRDRYLPLRVIKDKLAELDAGIAGSDQPLIPHLVAKDGEPARQAVSMGVADVVSRTGVSQDLVDELVALGVVVVDEHKKLSVWDEQIITLCAVLGEHGISARHLRAMRSAALRQVDVIEQSVRAVGRAASPSAQARRAAIGLELAEAFGQLHLTWLRQGISQL